MKELPRFGYGGHVLTVSMRFLEHERKMARNVNHMTVQLTRYSYLMVVVKVVYLIHDQIKIKENV